MELLTDPKQLYALVSLLGAAALYLYDWGVDERIQTLHALILGWSGLMYLNFETEWYVVELTYYADWILTTPMLVLALAVTATGEISERAWKAAVAQGGVITTGYLAVDAGDGMAMMFLLSCGLLVYVLLSLRELISEDLELLYWITAGTWVLYPVVWWYTGGELLAAPVAMVLIPFISKHGLAIADITIAKEQ
ncbi:hypothetical protein K0C01_05010 [Salinarchaeum sp. IM2453]|uniref:bacteriorhodopsin n=1 Tax=Salinarchaeum sp. IM2453 TaxID=2862870 RepID=UPI001C83C9A8|nr:bacteriorhodopsin [Salinarchaeum sp. IM2453]QZA89497.1 hypothetical protein K0C01_05010 [Salinarchaeum sp. IM2453]